MAATMLGRQVAVALRPRCARPVFHPVSFHSHRHLGPRGLVHVSQRSYATPSRPKKAVGEPSRPVKRAVKRAAKTSAKDEPATQKLKEKRAKATAAKKAAPKKKPAKQLTEKQRAAKTMRLERAKISQLKKDALDPPKRLTYRSAYIAFMAEKMANTKPSSTHGSGSAAVNEVVKELARDFKQLAPADIEHYNHMAQTANAASQAEYKRWVESHTPEQISSANRARGALRRKLTAKNRTSKYAAIADERAPKKPITAYVQFCINRHASGDFKNIAVTERAKLLSQEWKSLNESEKKKYKDLSDEDATRYSEEYETRFGHLPPYMVNNTQSHAAAAAASA